MKYSIWFPQFVLDIPERVFGSGAQFDVTYSDGSIRSFVGSIISVPLLSRSLLSRVSSDSSILAVHVFLSSGRCLCVCSVCAS